MWGGQPARPHSPIHCREDFPAYESELQPCGNLANGFFLRVVPDVSLSGSGFA